MESGTHHGVSVYCSDLLGRAIVDGIVAAVRSVAWHTPHWGSAAAETYHKNDHTERIPIKEDQQESSQSLIPCEAIYHIACCHHWRARDAPGPCPKRSSRQQPAMKSSKFQVARQCALTTLFLRPFLLQKHAQMLVKEWEGGTSSRISICSQARFGRLH